jgi:ATP-dependent protease ClpP protease subunit
MTAEQAQDFGIIDKVLTRREESELAPIDGKALTT